MLTAGVSLSGVRIVHGGRDEPLCFATSDFRENVEAGRGVPPHRRLGVCGHALRDSEFSMESVYDGAGIVLRAVQFRFEPLDL